MLRRKTLTPEQRAANEERELWAKRFAKCWACGRHADWIETHEIVRRSETADWRHVANYARLCRECHEEAHGGYITKGVLLTLKLIFDPGGYDLDWILSHTIKKGTRPEALPTCCRWFIRESV